MLKSTEVLVIGAGAAGLEAAYTAAKAGKKVLVISKGATASAGILGFCAPIGKDDSAELFEQDTMKGGWNIGRPSLVRALACGSEITVKEMEQLGVLFDRKAESTEYQLLKPLGCSAARLVKDGNLTGQICMETLKREACKLGVEFLNRTVALELLVVQGVVRGTVCIDLETDEIWTIRCESVILATGGAHMMSGSTYPMDETADGQAMAYHVGAILTDLEFVQHEPCRAIWPKPLGISTTLLAKGGILTNRLGERFVLKHYPTEGAVPKDMLARLVALEIQEGRGTEHGGVNLDLTGLPAEEIIEHHSLYYKRFLEVGIDLTRDIVEVGPAAHSMMGGIEIDDACRTSVPGLFAAGEVTGGLHGANRLGGNAGAEVFVFGRIAGSSAATYVPVGNVSDEELLSETECVLHALSEGDGAADDARVMSEARRVLAEAAGPARNGVTLETARGKLENLRNQVKQAGAKERKDLVHRAEVLHTLEIGILICRAAFARQESRGVHYRTDWPERQDDKWIKSIRFHHERGMTIGS